MVDLPTGRLTGPPDPTWAAVGMIGSTGVLRKDTRSILRAETYDSDAFCVAAHPDTPQEQCGRVPGATAPGQPLIATDGRVEWVPATSVAAVTLTDPDDGTVYTGLAQPGPTQLLSLSIDITGSETGLRGDQRFAVFDRMSLPLDQRSQPNADPGRVSLPIRWYTIDSVTPTMVTGTLHTSPDVYADISVVCSGGSLLWSGYVLDPDTAIVGCRASTTNSHVDFNLFIRVSTTGPLEVVDRIAIGRPFAAGPDSLLNVPTIYYWPPAVSGAARS